MGIMNWSGLWEERPSELLEETPKTDVQGPAPTGNVNNCYLCTRSFQGLESNAIVRRDYERYFITLCWWCNHQFIPR